MKFRAHDTFFIRKGWLYKGMKNLVNDPTVFMGINGNPMDILGIGANMVKALRYWLQAVGLTSEPLIGRKSQKLTSFGEIIYENDRFIEEMGTLWLLHYKLASYHAEREGEEDFATAWYYFFNEFGLNEFSRDDFILKLKGYVLLKEDKDKGISERALEEDFNCIINTYLPRIKSNPSKVSPENNIDCPLGELGLIDIVDKRKKIYKKCAPKKDTLHPLILLSVILDNANGEKEIKISSIQNDKNNAGRIFNLDIITLVNLLNRIEHLGYIKVIRTAGLDIIRLEKEIDFLDAICEYYQTINN